MSKMVNSMKNIGNGLLLRESRQNQTSKDLGMKFGFFCLYTRLKVKQGHDDH